MTLDIRREDLDALEAEWRDLLPVSPLHCAFVHPLWLRTWWEQFGTGRELLLLAARDGGKLLAVAPLMREDSRLTFAGDTQICDYMDICAPPGDRIPLLTALLRGLSEEPWSEIALWALPEDSPTLAALPAACQQLGLSLQQEVEDVCPQIDLPGTVEEYFQRLDKKDRHELRRKLRKLPQGGDVSLEVIGDPQGLSAAMDDFIRMHVASRAEKAAFMTPQMEAFFRRVVPALAGEGMAEMTFLCLSGRRVAAVLCFRTEDELLLYNSGYDPDYAGLSVGLLSKALALERAIQLGYKRFDFLRGAEPYKYDLGAHDFRVYRCLIRRTENP